MYDDTTENFSNEQLAEPNRPHRSTGPTSPEGKARSSLNRLTHGCRSEQIIINGEDPAEFEFLMDHWFNAYEPQDFVAQGLVEELGKAHWMLKRNEKWLHQIHRRLPLDAWTWTDEHHKLLANATRYKTTAERSFYRALNNLEAHYKHEQNRAAQVEKAHRAIDARCAREEKARTEMAKIHIQWLKKKAEAAALDRCLVQKVEIMANGNGDCITTYAPTNAEVSLLANSASPPEFITRYIFFNFGVPAAYDWTNPDHLQRHERTIGIQQFTRSGWLAQVEAEKVAADGHIAPYRIDLLLETD